MVPIASDTVPVNVEIGLFDASCAWTTKPGVTVTPAT
jgi:hypothetical protein